MSSLIQAFGSDPVVARFLQRLPQDVGVPAGRALGGSGAEITDIPRVLSLYRRQRTVGLKVHNRLLKTIEMDLILDAARSLGLVKGRERIAFEDEHQSSVLQDFTYYSVRRDGETLIEQHARQSSIVWNDEELAILKSGADCRFCIVLVEKMFPGLGFDFVDLLTGEQGFLVDVNLSSSATVGSVFVSHLVPVCETNCWCTTGAAVPLADNRASRLVFEQVKQLDRRHQGLHHMPPEQRVRFEAFVVRTCLQLPGTARVAYASPMS